MILPIRKWDQVIRRQFHSALKVQFVVELLGNPITCLNKTAMSVTLF
jgi:hypothetical protein